MLPLSEKMLCSLEAVIRFHDRTHNSLTVAAGSEQRTFRALLRRGYVREAMSNGVGDSWYKPTATGRELIASLYESSERLRQRQCYKAAEARGRVSLLAGRLANG